MDIDPNALAAALKSGEIDPSTVNPAQLASALRGGVPEHLAPTEEQAYAATLGTPSAGLTWDDIKGLPGRMFGNMSLPNPVNVARDTYRGLSNADPLEETGLNLPGDVATGKVNPLSDEGIGKATNLAGMMVGGGGMAGAGAESGVTLGSGRVRGGGGYRRMTEVPDIRGLPVEEGIRIARREPHLIEKPAGMGHNGGPPLEDTGGAYVGGPRDVETRRDLLKIRRENDKFLAEEPRGGDWYDRYRGDIAEVTGNNPVDNKWMAKQEGQWSAGASPETELAFALKENNSALAGEPVKAGRPASHEAMLAAIAANNPDLLGKGKKTGEYASKINPDNREISNTATGVNDFRWQRQLGYTNADGSLPSSGNHMVQDTVHKAMDYETALYADRANKKQLDGRSNWNGEQVQAAMWVRQKAESLMGENPSLTYDEAFKRANATIGDFYDKHTVAATHEAIPGAMTGHLPGMVGADNATRAAYSLDPRSSWANAPGGRDAIYGGMRLGDTGVAMRVRPTIENQGIYTPPGGELETNPGATARPLVAFDTGKGGTKSVAAADQKILNAGEALRAYVDAQGAGAWHKTWAGGRAGDSTSLLLPLPGKATPEQLMAIKNAGEPHGLTDVSDTGRGVTATSFYPGPPDAKALAKALRGGLSDELKAATGVMPERVKMQPGVDSGYIGYEDKWTQGVGSGAATREMLSHINATPEIRQALNQNPFIPQNALARLERDHEWSAKMGATREDIQNARSIIGEGPGWVDRIEAALKAGAVLPAVAAAVIAASQSGSQPGPGGGS